MRSPRLGDAAVVYDFMATLLRDLSIALLSVFFLSSFFFLPLTYWSLSFTTTFLELAYRKVLLLMYDGSLEVDFGSVDTSKLQREIGSMAVSVILKKILRIFA